jgi:hypothetical protein
LHNQTGSAMQLAACRHVPPVTASSKPLQLHESGSDGGNGRILQGFGRGGDGEGEVVGPPISRPSPPRGPRSPRVKVAKAPTGACWVLKKTDAEWVSGVVTAKM